MTGSFSDAESRATEAVLARFNQGPDRSSSMRGVNLMRVRGGQIVEALGM